MKTSQRLIVIALALAAAGLAAWVRAENAIGILVGPAVGSNESAHDDTAAAQANWGSYDPDTLYHARRVARAVEDGGWVASRDPLLDHVADRGVLPQAIPWPPVYDLALAAVVRGALPDIDWLFDPERKPTASAPDGPERARIERLVSTAPLVIGALTAFLASLAAAGLLVRSRAGESEALPPLAAPLAAAVAGVTVAFTFGHVRYSHLGNGDHHAFVGFLHLCLLAVVAYGTRPEQLARTVRAALLGGLAGVLSGLLIATWTASILYVALIQFVLVLRLYRPFQGPDGRPVPARALPLFATSFHKTALLVILPAIISSPATAEAPFRVVDLSWFHFAWLTVGWIIFAPYALAPRMVSGRRFIALLPALIVAAALLVSATVRAELAVAVSWLRASNPFMGTINESKSLLGEGGSLAALVKYCGGGVLVAPLVVVAALGASRRRPEILPWAVTVPVLLVMALLQRRFAEGLVPPMAVLLGAYCVGAVAKRGGTPGRPFALGAAALLFLSLAAHPASLRNTLTRNAHRLETGQRFVPSTATAASRAATARVIAGLRSDGGGEGAVLAQWDLGHSIEWRAGLPTVATNFGLYLGEDSFLDPWRYFIETDEAAGEALLDRRGVRYILVGRTTSLRRDLMASAVGVEGGADRWPLTMAARLLREGGEGSSGAPLPVPAGLRLIAQVPDPAGGTFRVYERVPGARLIAAGRSLAAVVRLEGAEGQRAEWRGSVTAPGGVPDTPLEQGLVQLELRVPFPSAGELGDSSGGGLRIAGFEVFLDGRPLQDLQVSAKSVDEGAEVAVFPDSNGPSGPPR